MRLVDCWKGGAGRSDLCAAGVGVQDNAETLRRKDSQRNHEYEQGWEDAGGLRILDAGGVGEARGDVARVAS